MRNTYSLYEAKARLSALVRMVRDGNTIVVTLHGEPVVEMRPIHGQGSGLKARMDQLSDRGMLVRPTQSRPAERAAVRKAGALKRFLADRE